MRDVLVTGPFIVGCVSFVQVDLIEDDLFTNVIVPQTVLDEVSERAKE